MRRLVLLATTVLLLSACATPMLEGPDALRGKELHNATALFGPWNQRLEIKGRPVYIWRRTVENEGAVEGCELRVEMGFRQAIARSRLEGYPSACSLFRVIYEPDRR